MKKQTLTGFVAAAVLLTTSCAEDNNFRQQPTGDGNVSFTVQLPSQGLGSRAFADGKTANDLVYAVYDADNDTYITTGNATFTAGELQTTVSLSLANGKSYKIAFFAHNAQSDVYTFDAEAKTFEVDYSKMADYNTVDHDAFYKLHETGLVTGPINQSVELTRPLAQINWGTNDLKKEAVEAAYGKDAANLLTKVEFKGVYSKFDLLTGQRDEATITDVTFDMSARPTDEIFPVENYEYLSMNYILAAEESTNVDAEFSVNNTDAANVVVANMPVQANYRTNVYGSLLTSTAEFIVTKEPNFEKPDYNLEWNGEVDTDLPTDETDDNLILISNAAQLAGLAQLVNNSTETYPFKGKTVKLMDNIDLNNVVWTPIGYMDGKNGSIKYIPFCGTFDGNNMTISNLNAVNQKAGDANTSGLFGYLGTYAQVKDLTIDGATVRSSHYAGALVGYTHSGNGFNDAVVITNCNVKNATISSSYADSENSGDKAGAISGFIQCASISNCTVEDVTISAVRDAGVFTGTVTNGGGSQKVVFTQNTATNVTVTVTSPMTDATNAGKGMVYPLFGRVITKAGEVQMNEFAHAIDNVTYIFKDFDCTGNTDNSRFIAFNTTIKDASGKTLNNTLPDGVSVELDNVKCRSVYVAWRTQNTKDCKLTLKNCEIAGDENQPTSSDGLAYYCRTGIQFYAPCGGHKELTVLNSKFSNTWSHGIMVHKAGDVDINVSGCSFKDWGKKEESKEDIETSSAMKVYNCNIGKTEEGRNELRSAFIANNSFNPLTTKEYSYTFLNVTNEYDGVTEVFCTTNLNDWITY